MTGAARAVAKATLDWAVYNQQGSLLHLHTPNTVAGIKLALRQLKALPSWNITQVVFCMEHTAGTVVKSKFWVKIFSISLAHPKDNSAMVD